MRRILLSLPFLMLPLLFALPALAGDWGENWGTLTWGAAIAAVPSMGKLAVLVLVLALGGLAARFIRRGRAVASLLVIGLVIPMLAPVANAQLDGGIFDLHIFTDGTPALASEVNANFEAVETAVNDNDSRITTLQGVAATAQSTADSNAAQISNSAPVISGNTSNISLNSLAIQSANVEISSNASNTSLNSLAIQSANVEISSNASNTSTNTAAIAANHAAPATRFEACADGVTVADHDTGLLWERKTGTPVDFANRVSCDLTACPDPHDVANAYEWIIFGTEDNGNAYTDFLARLNGDFLPDAATGCFANRCDWRLPKIAELQTILVGPEAAPAQAATCGSAPCIDPAFAALGGPTNSSPYWSQTGLGINNTGTDTVHVWVANFSFGDVVQQFTYDQHDDWIMPQAFVRAVRAGSCTN